jgi:hypothetical protein
MTSWTSSASSSGGKRRVTEVTRDGIAGGVSLAHLIQGLANPSWEAKRILDKIDVRTGKIKTRGGGTL